MASVNRNRPTLNDIAAEAGVSLSAVSRALRHPGRLNERTEAHIRDVARRLGYLDAATDRQGTQPAATAASTTLVVIIAADINDATTAHAIDGMRRRLAARGYHALIIEESDIITRDGLAAQFRKLPVCGAIIQRRALRDQEIRALAAQLPIVLVGRGLPGVCAGTIDTADAVARMIDALKAEGRTSLTYLAAPDDGVFGTQLRAQIAAEAARQGIAMLTLLGCQPDTASARGTLERFLNNPTHAVFSPDNRVAVRFMAAARARGIAVPDELAVVGFGDDDAIGLDRPTLARISCPAEELGTDCAESLISLVKAQRPADTSREAAFVPAGSIGKRTRALSASAVRDDRTPLAEVRSQPIELTMMASSFQDWEQHIAEYERLHPEVSVRRIWGGTQAEIVSSYYQRVREGRDIPDITVIEYRWLPQLAEDRLLLNLNTPSVRAAFRRQFVGDCWDAVSWRGGVYGVPCDYDTTMLFRRTDVFDRFGVETPRTWAEMMRMGAALRAQDPRMRAVAVNTLDSAPFIALLYMAGARPWSMDADGTTIQLALTSEPVRRTTAFLRDGIDQGDVLMMNFNDTEFRQMVADGLVACVLSANWFCENIVQRWPDERGLWRAALPPSFGDPSELRTAHIGGSAWTISNRVPPERRNAAAQLAFWAQTDPASIDVQLDRVMSASTYFHRNPRLTGKIDPFFNQKLYDVFFEAAEHIAPDFRYLPFMPQVEAVFANTVRPQLVPGGDPVGQLANWQSQIAAFARAKGYRVEVG
ncbi:extracellular solute-binding protein [Bifidobacterium biavatii]|uniref:ABC transporter, extracellular substrate binding protein, probably Lactose porter n=1 Tax=Bifidobacterium biavatii DSM 23969 TaxID=1437608 RepID=A0A087A1L9_9BIFI|nr:extracellular solute-binding protein [Bifidobacterium biavatii]KFI52669.1 ABC transporter, extracellular substrate binding protein, probably Lactose porter [Bifidobacterium biavatii DSM 23969]